jgi:hypothetical protein
VSQLTALWIALAITPTRPLQLRICRESAQRVFVAHPPTVAFGDKATHQPSPVQPRATRPRPHQAIPGSPSGDCGGGGQSTVVRTGGPRCSIRLRHLRRDPGGTWQPELPSTDVRWSFGNRHRRNGPSAPASPFAGGVGAPPRRCWSSSNSQVRSEPVMTTNSQDGSECVTVRSTSRQEAGGWRLMTPFSPVASFFAPVLRGGLVCGPVLRG